MQRKMFLLALILVVTALSSVVVFGWQGAGVAAQGPQPQAPQVVLGTGFTYQGQLKNNGVPVSGSCDIAFRVFDAASGGSRISVALTPTVAITNGLFTTVLDFGPNVFTGEPRWLDMLVHCPSVPGAFTALGPRQALTAVPYAFALPGFRTEPNATSPNILGGHISNTITPLTFGSAILGGGDSLSPNSIDANYSVVVGGRNNNIIADNAFIGGGLSNTVSALSDSAFIGGGQSNTVNGVRALSVVIGGGFGNAAGGLESVIGGGSRNTSNGDNAFIGGGEKNIAGDHAVVGGGLSNIASGPNSVVPGGAQNQANGFYSFAGGLGARAIANGDFVWADSVGVPFTSTANNQFVVRAAGGFGIGTNAPAAQLHVLTAISGVATNVGDHVAVIENNSAVAGSGPDVLALKITNIVTPDASMNYVTFFAKNGAIAAIEGNGSGGVTYKTVGADFAEYLPLRASAEQLNTGDIVGMVAGLLSKQTQAEAQVFVVSSAAGFVGNMPRAGSGPMALVALMGQVGVNVRGMVKAGDFIVPSGLNDGIGIAVAPETITSAQFAQVVGQAWESALDANVKSVRVAVGLTRNDPTVQRMLEHNAAQTDQLSSLEARVAELERSKQASSTDSGWLDARTLVLGLLLAAVASYQVRRARSR